MLSAGAAGPAWLCLLVALTSSVARGGDNLVANPGFEEAGEKELPAQWEPFVIGVPARFALDLSEKHSGQRSIRITAAESARSYMRSRPIPVVAGEAIRFSAWVKHEGVPSGKGTVIAIAEFTNAQDLGPEVAKLGVADTSKPGAEWRKIEGRVQAPEAAAFVRLRLGFSYAQGTCWWDDVVLGVEKTLVARVDLPGQRLSPAAGAVPIVILNRNRQQG